MITLRDYQDEEVQSVFDYYTSGETGNPLIAAPTGTGKSVVIAKFCQRVLHHWPNQRIAVVTHVKELIEQNAKAMLRAWPTAPVGIYSAGLASRDTMQSIIFGGVQSMVKAPDLFGLRHLMIVDEAHLVSPKVESSYQKLIEHFKKLNPNFKVIGLTATAYRTGQGSLAGDGNIFTHVCCDHTSMNRFNWFIDQGYLVPLIPKKTSAELDVSNVSITNGDYQSDQLQKAVDQHDITFQCCRELIQYGAMRRSWLLFASGVQHAEHVADCLRTLCVNALAVHGELPKEERDSRIASFKNGALRCMVVNNICTTGFDYPGLDLIGMLRPTTSCGLWVQMLGRGTRPLYWPGFDLSTREGRLASIAYSAKQNCLVLDFAGNTRRLGPINDPIIPKKRVKGSQPGVAPIKICPQCGVYNHAQATVCENPACAYKFERSVKLTQSASEAELIRSDLPVINEMQVQRILYTKQDLKGRPPALKVSYFCGFDYVKEMLFFENTGFARTKARKWWRERSATEPPNTVDEALAQQQFLREPKAIRVHQNKKFPEITEYVW